MKHLVNSLKFDLHCTQETQAFALRREVMEDLQPLLADSIESVWNMLSPGDACLQIDRLEIDLGKITAEGLKEQFAPQFRQQFEQKLMEYLSRLAENGSAGTLRRSGFATLLPFYENRPLALVGSGNGT